MKLQTKYQIEKVASKDWSRHALQYVHIDAERKRLVATDGRTFAMVPVTLEDGDDIGNKSITAQVLVDARKKAKKSVEAVLTLNGSFTHVDGTTVPRPHVDEVGQYPQYDQIIPKEPLIKNTVTLNPEALLNLAKALGDSQSITLEFQDQSGDPAIIARNGDAYGLIMPLRGGR